MSAPVLSWIPRLLAVLALIAATGCQTSPADSGPRFTIGLVTNNPNGQRNVQGFVDGMAELGYVAGDTVTYLYAGEPVTGADLDRELEGFVATGVDLIFTAGTPTGVAAHRITAGSGIPVVFGVIADPVAAGVMENLAHPGGNMTGIKLGQHQDRRLELLLQIVPDARQILVPHNPNDSAAATAVAQIMPVAEVLDVELVLAEARSNDEVSRLLDNVPRSIDAVFLVPDSTVNRRLADIVNLARERRFPISGPSTAQVEEGAVMTYGFIHARAGHQAAHLADQILRGIDPGDIPVEDTEPVLAINIGAAEHIGLTITDQLLHQAEIILRPGEVEVAAE